MRRSPALLSLIILLGMPMPAASAAAAPPLPRVERVASCSWDRPGHNPFMGDVVTSIDRYTDIPANVRMRLKQRMQARQYDDFVDIRRDGISGRASYEPTIRDMHFGLDRVCQQVTRERWTAQTHERGVVYCEQEHCILVPTVCRNVSRITRRPALVAGEPSRAPVHQTVAGSAPVSGPTDTSSERSMPTATTALGRGQGITSSFAEAVAGATLPLQPMGGTQGDTTSEIEGSGWLGPGAGPSIWRSTPNFTVAPPVSSIPEPATWACLAVGLVVLRLVSARRRRTV